MTGLEDVFGESFAEQFEKEREKRINARNQVDGQTMAGIAYKIVEEDALDPKEPQFTFTDDNGVAHDVLLMTVPDPDDKPVWSYMNELNTGAVSLPLDYMGEWMSVLFNEKDMVADINQGDDVIVVGNLDQWTPEGSDEPQDQISPARGLMLLDELEEHASQYEQGEMEQINDAPPEQEEPEVTEEDDDSSDDGGSSNPFSSGSSDDSDDDSSDDSGTSFSGFGSSDDEEEEEEDDGYNIDEDTVQDTVDELAEHKEEVLELEEGDERLQDVAMFYIDNEMNPEQYDKPELKEIVSEVSDIVVDYLNELREDEDEEDDEGDIFDNSDSIFG